MMLGDFRIDQLAAQCFEAFEHMLPVRPHQPEYPATSRQGLPRGELMIGWRAVDRAATASRV